MESGNNMGYPFGKVHDKRTITYVGRMERTGIYIDIFPIDNVRNMNDFQERHEKVKELIKKRAYKFDWMRVKAEPFDIKRWCLILKHGVPRKTYEQIAEDINCIACENHDVETPLVYEMVAGMRCKQPIPVEVFKEYSDIKFENRQYMAVNDYDTYLSMTFGDYMTLPPTKERVRHMFKAYWR